LGREVQFHRLGGFAAGCELPLRDGGLRRLDQERAATHRLDLLDVSIRGDRGNDPNRTA
jgi:hypothetical protein